MGKKATVPPPNPNDIPVVQLTIPYSTSSHRGQQDRHVLGPQRAVDIEHRVLHATQYEFYLPAAIWILPMTKLFIERISNLAPGATIFKGATGVWREEKEKGEKGEVVEEDVYSYRIIVNAEVIPADNVRNGIHTEIANLSAALVSNSERGYHVFSDVGTKLEFVGFNEAVHVRAATDIFSRIGLTRCLSDPYIPSADVATSSLEIRVAIRQFG